jgi:hypothetical protein
LLIEDPSGISSKLKLPSWRGMTFEAIKLDIHEGGSKNHLCLALHASEHESVFKAFCQDLVQCTEGCEELDKRDSIIKSALDRWTLFFMNTGSRGLSPQAQRGLLAELIWASDLLEHGLNASSVIDSWKGCERRYQDFDYRGKITEIKSTMTKEPRTVRISNERQLDPRGLLSLHLFVVTVHQVEGGGTSLVGAVEKLRGQLAGDAGSLWDFEQKLIKAGYHLVHVPNYGDQYLVRKKELFEVCDDFPRIVDLPHGTGNLRYSVTLSDCQKYLCDQKQYLTSLE